MKKIKVGIAGGAGYTGGELLRILLFHPSVEIAFVHSNSHAGHPLYEVHQDLLGDTHLHFTGELDFSGIDALFLCLGHGKSVEFLKENTIPDHVRIIDLSQDFRNQPIFDADPLHPRTFVYGLPELFREEIISARNIANPGCFATAFELALLPLAAHGLITDEIHVQGITGSTGAGQALSSTSHFSWRNNNISVYKAFTHQHLKEVRKFLEYAAGISLPSLWFIPVRGNFSRGIFLTAYTRFKGVRGSALALYKEYYQQAAFTFVSDKALHLKQVVNTNKCLIQVEEIDDQILISAAIDNLAKGASGQAVQNLNLMFGLGETSGLHLKSVMF